MYRRPVKTKNSLFFPHLLRKKSGNWGEWWPKNNPKWSSYHPIWSISCKAVKIFVYSKYVWEKEEEEETNISTFSAYTRTHKLTFVRFLSFLFYLEPVPKIDLISGLKFDDFPFFYFLNQTSGSRVMPNLRLVKK